MGVLSEGGQAEEGGRGSLASSVDKQKNDVRTREWRGWMERRTQRGHSLSTTALSPRLTLVRTTPALLLLPPPDSCVDDNYQALLLLLLPALHCSVWRDRPVSASSSFLPQASLWHTSSSTHTPSTRGSGTRRSLEAQVL